LRAGCGELGIARGIDDIDTGAEHRDRRAAARKPAAVRGGVDTERQARDDCEACIAERARELLGVARALCGRVPAADDGECGLCEQAQPPVRVQHRRRIGDLKEATRIGLVGERDDVVIVGACPLQGTFNGIGDARRAQRLQRGLPDKGSEFGIAAGEHRLRQAKLLEETADRCSAETRGERELQPARQSRIGRHAGAKPSGILDHIER
jgi:hypothetical protein